MVVLIVDDDEDTRELMRLVLEGGGHEVGGYEVIEAPHGGIGLDLVATRRPDAVLLDLMMPEVDGFEFLARLPDVAAPPPPVIVISGFDTYRDEVLGLGAFAYLEKPFSNRVLLQTLVDAFARRVPDAQLLHDHRQANQRTRREARENAQELVRRVALADERVLPSLQAVVDFLPQFFGFGTSLVQTLRGDDLTIEAIGGTTVSGRGVPLGSGMAIPRHWSFCDGLLDVGSSLVLPDARHHRIEQIASHTEVQQLGWSFYLGVSIKTSAGVVGALCHLAPDAHAAHAEDVVLLIALANRIGDMFEQVARDAPVRPVCDGAGCFAEDLAPVLGDVALRRALRRSRAGVLLHLALGRDDAAAAVADRLHALDGLSSVLIEGPEQRLTAILSGRDRDATARDVDLCDGVYVRAVGSAWWHARPAPDLDRFDTSSVLAALSEEARRTLALGLAGRIASG